MALTANQRLCKQPGEKRKFEMSFASVLGTSESITNITSGSTIFGNSTDDVHLFTGSLNVTGSLSAIADIIGYETDGSGNKTFALTSTATKGTFTLYRVT